MVLHKKGGDQVPRMPQIPRSARGKRSIRKKAEDNEMCAFDLLATVAGQLLASESSPAPFAALIATNPNLGKVCVKQEQLDNWKSTEANDFDHTSCHRSTLGPDGLGSCSAEDRTHTSSTRSGCSSAFVKLDTSEKDVSAGKSTISGSKIELGYPLGTILEKCSKGRSSSDPLGSCKIKMVVDCPKTLLQAEPPMHAKMVNPNASGMHSMEDPMDVDAKPPALVSSESSAEVPRAGAHMSNSSILKHGEHFENVAIRHDDDENSSGCTHPSTMPSKAFRPQRIGGRKIRKLLGSKYWKVAPSALNDRELSETEMKPVYRNRRMGYTRQRTQRCMFKRVKQVERRVISADGGMYGEGTPNSYPKAGIKLEANDPHATSNGANGASSSTIGTSAVQFSIKSFKVPELFIEIPESATVGSLKRTVMEAVSAILGNGLRVGVLLQGKKVRDDNKTLGQAGISHDQKLDLGFTLEPSPPSLASPGDELLHPPCDTKPLIRIPGALHPDQGAASATLKLPLINVLNCPESDHDSVHSTPDVTSLDKTDGYFNALVAVPATSCEPLDVVPLRKSRRAELVQRRIRRPFSVNEVEALVQAVEKLGTGRWRDVKIRAFDNAKHRTYVDLKDKWKTLVHTARISPQQRRGEPVPQDLLDRVLAAHAYWTQQQAKLQMKSGSGETCLLL